MWRWGDSEAFLTPNITSSQFVELPEAGWRSNSCPKCTRAVVVVNELCVYIYMYVYIYISTKKARQATSLV